MIKVLIFVAAAVCLSNGFVRDYYWRDFNGKITKDAFAFNETENLYIAQGLTDDGKILVGSIDTAPATYTLIAFDGKKNKTINIVSNVKILCTENPEHLVWASNGIKTKGAPIRVYGGVDGVNDSYSLGTLAITRKVDGTPAIGYHDVTSSNVMYYVEDKSVGKTEYNFEELYYIGPN